MKKVVISLSALILGSLLHMSHAQGVTNLVRTDFQDDNYGGIVDWKVAPGCSAERLDMKGPGNMPVLRMNSKTGKDLVSTGWLLEKGEPYRVSAYVRTKGLESVARKQLIFQDGRKFQGKIAIDIPSETDGEWVLLQWEGELFSALSGNYVLHFETSGNIPEGAYIDICNPCLEPLSPKAQENSWPVASNQPYKFRISPVWPEVYRLDPHDAAIKFHYPGEHPLLSEDNYIIRAELDGIYAEAPLGKDGTAVLRFGEIPMGRELPLTVRAVDTGSGRVVAENDYRAHAAADRMAQSEGRKLNNLVTELLCGTVSDLKKEFSLDVPKTIYVGLGRECRGLSVLLDGLELPLYSESRAPEATRPLSEGSHTIEFRGVNGRNSNVSYTVREVGVLLFSGTVKNMDKGQNLMKGSYLSAGYDFLRDMGYFSTCNHIILGDAPMEIMENYVPEWENRGITILNALNIRRFTGDPVRFYPDRYEQWIKESDPAYSEGKPVVWHENFLGASWREKFNTAEIWWKVNEKGHPLHTYTCGFATQTVNNPVFDTAEYSAYCNSGDGGSLMIHEAYYPSYCDAASYGMFLEWMKGQIMDFKRIVPSFAHHSVYMLNGWNHIGSYTMWDHAAMDMKAMNSDIYRMLATSPEFEGIAGIGFSTATCDDDLFRFSTDAIHYYGIEGGTGSYAEKFGITLFDDYLRNGEFSNGLDCWNTSVSEGGSVRHANQKGFGRDVQTRRYGRNKDLTWGDDYALFEGSDTGENVLSQKLTGLEKGKLYSLTFSSFDARQFEGIYPESQPTGKSVYARIKGAKVYPQMTQSSSLRNSRTPMYTFYDRIVFRATSDEAVLEFHGNGKKGSRWGVNYVGVRPYYVRDESQFRLLLKHFNRSRHWKDTDTEDIPN